MREIYDEVRGLWVSATPEEVVRQTWLKRMIGELGYPKALFAIEKELKTLPHLQESNERVPDRRADIIFFSPQLLPLLLVECKAQKISSAALAQVRGYNSFVRAFYVALVNETEVLFYDQEKELRFMPSYEQLHKAVR